MSTVSNASEIYDAFSEEYRAYSEGKSRYLTAVDGLIAKQFKGNTTHVLDFGAGDGVRGGQLFQQLDAQSLVQVDVSSEMVKKCKELGIAECVFDSKSDDWLERMPKVDLAMMLWNVLGHVPSTEQRIEVLSQLRQSLKPGGSLCFDVNNRHYVGYGRLNSIVRRIHDFVSPDFSRGDVEFVWKVGENEFPATGHFFTRAEVETLLEKAGLVTRQFYTIDYSSGRVSKRTSQGQLLFVTQSKG